MLAYLFPGQGSQFKGMGRDLLHSRFFPLSLEQQIDEILGYSLKAMCLDGPEEQLRKTEITQPCLFIINALYYLKYSDDGRKASYLAGHSLGEYNALLAAGAFDILSGLRLVVRRGQLMAAAPKGTMAAVLGIDAGKVASTLKANGLAALDIANFNTPAQVVISGPMEAIARAESAITAAGASAYIPLQVSAAFHSRYMEAAAQEFAAFMAGIEFKPLNAAVISNVTARPYPMEGGDSTRALLAQQIKSQVLWSPSVAYMKAKGVKEFIEAGPGATLKGMLPKIPAMEPAEELNAGPDTGPVASFEGKPAAQPAKAVFAAPEPVAAAAPPAVPAVNSQPPAPHSAPSAAKNGAVPGSSPALLAESAASAQHVIAPEDLGNAQFNSDYGVRYAYAAGAMYKGIASKELVAAMSKKRLLSYLGTGGLEIEEIEASLRYIKEAAPGGPYGVNLLHQLGNLQAEERIVDCYLKHGVQNVEAAAYMSLTPAIVRFRLTGLSADSNGALIRRHRILAKVSRPEVAGLFMRPAPEYIVKRLTEMGKVTPVQAELARTTPMADDICVEADLGGHTDGGVALTLFPAILLLRDEIIREYATPPSIRVGAAGGIGTPHAAAAAFIMGADFILTGSINQCTIEAGTSNSTKDLLETIGAQDTAYAPAGDMFEYGAKVQVVRKGLFFHTRANILYDLYTRYNSIEEIDEKTKIKIEEKFFRKKIQDVWAETRAHYAKSGHVNIAAIERSPKQKMAFIFKWYFVNANRLALEGREEQKVDYQIQCGPALGAFNRWVKGTPLESWRQRYVDEIAELLMKGTAELLTNRINRLKSSHRGQQRLE